MSRAGLLPFPLNLPFVVDDDDDEAMPDAEDDDDYDADDAVDDDIVADEVPQ